MGARQGVLSQASVSDSTGNGSLPPACCHSRLPATEHTVASNQQQTTPQSQGADLSMYSSLMALAVPV